MVNTGEETAPGKGVEDQKEGEFCDQGGVASEVKVGMSGAQEGRA